LPFVPGQPFSIFQITKFTGEESANSKAKKEVMVHDQGTETDTIYPKIKNDRDAPPYLTPEIIHMIMTCEGGPASVTDAGNEQRDDQSSSEKFTSIVSGRDFPCLHKRLLVQLATGGLKVSHDEIHMMTVGISKLRLMPLTKLLDIGSP
jgi:hypothetical protein